MKTVGIIAEYNPFHKGHQFHIEKAKEITSADSVIVVMSGNFVQRGTPAIMPKHLRAEAALNNGADLVLELPVCYATGTAEQFSYGAVSLLNSLGCVDTLCFGSECGDITLLQEVAHILSDESIAYKNTLQELLKTGLTYPAARQKSLDILYPEKKFAQLLEEPNNILGIEYLKALHRLNSSIEPYSITRQTSHYHDTELKDDFSSASAIRNVLQCNTIDPLASQVPADCFDMIKNLFEVRLPIYMEDFSSLLKYKLLNETKKSLVEYADVSEELANRIQNQLNTYLSYEQFCEVLKTKELTYARISRALIHILLNIKKTDYAQIKYARVLGFKSSKSDIMTKIKKSAKVSLITKLPATPENNMLEKDIFAANLYESMITDKFKTAFINEYKHPIVRI